MSLQVSWVWLRRPLGPFDSLFAYSKHERTDSVIVVYLQTGMSYRVSLSTLLHLAGTIASLS
jgi:hypothetical protein